MGSTEDLRSRRSLLAGAAAGLAGAAALAVGRAAPASAADTDPDAVHKNVNNPTNASTSITCSGSTAIRAISNSGGANRSGVFASASGTGSRGVTGVGVFGVLGQSGGPQGHGVHGLATGTNGIAVFGEATSPSGAAMGAVGRSKSPGGVGVQGVNLATSGNALGVGGRTTSPTGRGVFGVHDTTSGVGAGVEGATKSTTGVGVFGHADAATGGIGVAGQATTPSAFAGSFQGSGGAIALQAAGPVQFTTAGIATIGSGNSSVTVTPGVAINATSKVLCMLMSDPGGTTTIQRVNKNSGTTFQIILTAAATGSCDVAYFVIS